MNERNTPMDIQENENLGMDSLTANSTSEPEAPKAPESKEKPTKGIRREYLTRGNLISIGLSMFFTFLMIFVGICITVHGEGESSIVSSKNPIALLRQSLGLPAINAHMGGQTLNVLVAIFISLFVFAFIFEYRHAILDGKKWYAKKNWLWYVGTLLVCLALSVGFGLLLQVPHTKENLGNAMTFLGESLLISLLLYLFFAVLISAVLLCLVNFVHLGKPFAKVGDSLEEEDRNEDVAKGMGDDGSNGFQSVSSQISAENVEGGGAGGAGSGAAAEALTEREIVFPSLCKIDKHYEGYAIESIHGDDIALPELITKFRSFLAGKEKLYYDTDTLRFFVAGLAASHLEILEGLSGTGKSSLPRSFAKFVGGVSVFVPVQATWRDKTALIGYFNDFSKTYRETDFLMNLYEANYNPDRIYLFVLDEMNISRVEYYFADFLSVLEYPEDEWKIRVMHFPSGFVGPAKLEDGKVGIPGSAYFIGTANQDDSTFSIADKVYDRAITLSFHNRNAAFAAKEDVEPIVLSASKLHALFEEAEANKDYALTEADETKFEQITDYVYDEFGVAFGNRILMQMEKMVPVFIACGGKKETVLDFFLTRKILSKLEGRYEDNVKPGLEHILDLISSLYGDNKFNQSRDAIKRMLRRF